MSDGEASPADQEAQDLQALGRRLKAMFDTSHLDKNLRGSAVYSLKMTLRALAARDWVDASYQAGRAAEHYAKAVVFAHDRGRLGGDKPRAVAFLSGEGHPEVASIVEAYSIPAWNAVRTAFTVLGLTPPAQDHVTRCLTPRNAAAHMNVGNEAHALTGLATAVDLIWQLQERDWVTFEEFVGDEQQSQFLQALHKLEFDPTSQVNWSLVGALLRIWVAREEWASLKARLSPDQLAFVVEHPAKPGWAGDGALVTCPTGEHHVYYQIDSEKAQEQDIPGAVVYEHFHLGGKCSLCGLELDAYELHLLGMDNLERYWLDSGEV